MLLVLTVSLFLPVEAKDSTASAMSVSKGRSLSSRKKVGGAKLNSGTAIEVVSTFLKINES